MRNQEIILSRKEDVCLYNEKMGKIYKNRFNSKIGDELANSETVYINRITELADFFYDIGN